MSGALRCLALTVATVLTACGDATPDASLGHVPLAPQSAAAPASEGLRTHVWRVDIGTQIGGEEIFWNPGDQLLPFHAAREANLLLLGNNLKWAAPGVRQLRPARDTYDFTDADTLVALGEANGMKLKGHTLVWGEALPTWLTGGSWTRDQLVQILHEHISTVVGRYRGRIRIWDVVNEAFDWNGTYKDNFWLRGIGPEYVELAFQWAHEADPEALLFINEDGTEGMNIGSDQFLQALAAMLARGAPIHGVGLETHVDLAYQTLGSNFTATPAELSANIARIGALGLQVHLSEVDVRLTLPATSTQLAAQADIYKNLLAACTGNAACTGFIIWGVTDKWSWISRSFAGQGAALPLDESYAPKPAHTALLAAMRTDSDRCLDWAGTAYPGYIRPARPASAFFENYYYRYYPETMNYAAVANGRVYYWDPAVMAAPVEVMSLSSCVQAASG